MKFRSNALAALTLFAIVVCVFPTMGAWQTYIDTNEYTEGKAIGDSLAATADTLTGLPFPAELPDSMRITICAESLTVVTLQISPDGSTEWFTAATDSNAAMSSKTIKFPTLIQGYWYRVICDNSHSGTIYAEVEREIFRTKD
jgi:hypothetical protein